MSCSSENLAPVQPDRLVLASVSPRRASLLREAGYRFDAVAPPLDEPPQEWMHVDPPTHAESLAFFKASSVAETRPNDTILGADTVAVVNGTIVGKPSDIDDARRILRSLSDTTHDVVTGVALLCLTTGRRLIQHDISRLRFRPMTDDDIESYLSTGAWRGKAGAYGVQDHADRFVERIDGSFTNIVGLPMELVQRMFERWKDAPAEVKGSRSVI